MRHQCPPTLAGQTNTIDGYSYRVYAEAVHGGFQAQLIWISAPPVRERLVCESFLTPTFHNARAAILEAHSLALERVLAWRCNPFIDSNA